MRRSVNGPVGSDQRIGIPRPIVECSDEGADELGRLYWQELAGFTRGLVRSRRRGAGTELLLAGIVPLLRFGPRVTDIGADSVQCRYPIQGGLLAAGAGGELVIAQHTGSELSLAVTDYAPRLGKGGRVGRLLYAQLQGRLHAAAAARFLQRAAGSGVR